MEANIYVLILCLCLLPKLNSGADDDLDDNGKEFLNFGYKKLYKSDKIDTAKYRAKVDVLGGILKKHIDSIKTFSKLDIVFLIDSSSSIGEYNFKSELKFVKKLLSDVVVDYNHTRIALVAFSSSNNILKNVDEIGNASRDYNKCFLLTKQLRSIKYRGGETFTLGALKKAKEIFESSNRNDSKKVLFLITDGYSNGGDPIPVAKALKQNSVTIYTIGIRNGNYKELYDISSPPGEHYSYLLDSFNEFESLARRALHSDLRTGEYIPLGSNELCNKLCPEGDCCDEKASCSCGTTTGHYSCVCLPGYYGTGLRNDCLACTNGTYSNGPNSCLPCPDPFHITLVPASGLNSCKCREGYKATANNKQCKELKCPKLMAPENGYYVKHKGCPNVIFGACGIRCDVGYNLTGTSVRLCLKNGTWSGEETKCEIKTCNQLEGPNLGMMECYDSNTMKKFKNISAMLPVDAVCKFSCSEGYILTGSKERLCLPISRWSGLKAVCKPMKCENLTPIKYGTMTPSSCQFIRQNYGKSCKFSCNNGFRIQGPKERVCGKKGRWDNSTKTRCSDITPPIISCPEDLIINSLPGKKFGHATWNNPVATDNSNLNVTVWMKPTIPEGKKYKFAIGLTKIYYFAQDAFQNKANCSFQVIVKDNEPPAFENCEDPPTFLTNDPIGTNITWDEPIAFDNSHNITMTKSREFGFFEIGTTVVLYTAKDSSNNSNVCLLNITVAASKCEPLPNPPNGQSICENKENGISCVITCDEGYSIPISEATKDENGNETAFICNDAAPVWYSENGFFSECSVTQMPDEIQTGSVEISDINCSDNQNLETIKNEVRHILNAEFCSEKCNLTAEVDCNPEMFPESLKESQNSNIAKREARRINNKNRVKIKYQLRRKHPNRNRTLSTTQVQLKSGYRGSLRYNTKINCPKGSVQRIKRCVYCPKGTFHNISRNICQSCPFGEFNNKIGQTSCIQCPIHYSTGKLRSKRFEDCKGQCGPGTHARKKIQRVYKRFYNTTIQRATLMPRCSSCGIGFYQPNYGEVKCAPCAEGYTTTTIGSSTIEQCIPTAAELCRNNVCANGICTIINDYEYSCNCFDGYIGFHCEQQINACLSQPCYNGAICSYSNYNDYICLCKEGYTGQFCEDAIEIQTKTCLNNGLYYTEDNGTSYCLCPPEYTGDVCEIKINPCEEVICENNSTCMTEGARAFCKCSKGFIGIRCHLLPCDYRPCIESKICLNTFEESSTRDSYFCVCPEGFVGENCEARINHCLSSPCLNGGTCINGYSNYSCSCSNLYHGSNCELRRNSKYIFNFNTSTTSDFVKFKQFSNNLSDISACLWLQTLDDVNYGTIISYATDAYDNAFTLTDYTGLVLYVNNHYVVTDIHLNDGLWHHICVTWSSNGIYNIFLDTKLVKFGTSLSAGSQIQGMGSFILGQDQDTFGGGFSQSESFVGKITYVDVWSKILNPDEVVTHFIDCEDSFVGDLYAWPEIKDFAGGNVKVEYSDFCKICEAPKTLYNGFIDVVKNVAFYSCYPGFTLNNPEFFNGRKCTKASYWEGYYEPYCKRKYCGYPGSIRNGYVLGKRYFYEDEIKYHCYQGYNMTGNSTITCNENGQWAPAKPRCLGVQCLAFKQPVESNLIIMSDQSYEDYSENKTQFDIGTQIEVVCSESFDLTGESILTCLENGTWDFEPPKCLMKKQEKVGCSLDHIPQAPPNGYIDKDSYNEVSNDTLSVVKYKCLDGYKLVGDNTSSCIVDGYWSEPKMTCQPILCTLVPKFKNMIREQEEQESKKSFGLGDKISFKCEDGYQKLGTNLLIRCLDTGKWSRIQGKCLRKSCGKPVIADETDLEGGSYLFGDKVKLSCKSGSEYILVCNKNGTWDGEKDDSC